MLRLLVFIALGVSLPVWADANAPWGAAKEADTQYAKQKVVYDTTVTTIEADQRARSRPLSECAERRRPV